MNNVVAVQNEGRAVVDAHTAAEIKAQVNRIQEVMRGIMKAETHYGKIPGTQKPTLYKAGSEVLLSTFRIAVEPDVEDLSTGDEIRYRVIARGVHMGSGVTVGAGIGEASSSEEKYKWRSAVCEEEFDDTPEDQRRIKYGWEWGQQRGQKITKRIKQVRTNPADVANTVLKMAKKRAQIDLTLTALAASDIFSQDLEDMPEHMREVAAEEPRQASEAPKAADGPEHATASQLTLIRKKLERSGKSEEELCEALEVDTLDGLAFGKINEALAWLKSKAK